MYYFMYKDKEFSDIYICTHAILSQIQEKGSWSASEEDHQTQSEIRWVCYEIDALTGKGVLAVLREHKPTGAALPARYVTPVLGAGGLASTPHANHAPIVRDP